ncbi:MAG: DEAD/DEAH box helicase [Pseudomonadota bacterium]
MGQGTQEASPKQTLAGKNWRAHFTPALLDWFDGHFPEATSVQAASWPLIADGDHVLATAPTGSGKTLTAFLYALNQYASGAWAPGHTRVLYLSPLKALNNDIRENLLNPLAELEAAGALPEIRVQTRSGDTSPGDRQRMLRRPPEILITTPESLALLLTTRNGQNALTEIETVIIDEVHAIVDNRRGVQLMTALERLEELAGEFQRLALSATVEPLDAVAGYIGGYSSDGAPRPVHVVRAAGRKAIDFHVRFPEDVHAALENGQKIWDPLADAFRDRIDGNTATLFFTNSRRLAEKITFKINEDGTAPLAYAHHGSLAREIRSSVEQRLKGGELKAIVATSSLEMGIDVGHLDEVVLVQSPPSVAATLQRIGRAGHRVGETSVGSLFPTHAQDFLEAAVLSAAIAARDIEPLEPLTGCLDVLAQILISCTAVQERHVDDLYALLRRAAPYRDLSREQFDLVIEMLAGRYAGSRVRELKPRISYDRINGTVKALKSAVLAFYSNGGTIPDRGYYKLRHAESGTQIGELDEEFVWEATVGQTFAFGSQHWQIHRITHNDVLVRPAAPDTQAPPFWRSESYNRSYHFSARIGGYLEDVENLLADGAAATLERSLVAERGFEAAAATELTDYLSRQREATGTALPHRHHLLLESVQTGPGGYKGPDDISQLVLHSFWGGRLNRPWALALAAALEAHLGYAPEIHADNNAVAIQLKSPMEPAELLGLVRPDNLRALLRESLEQSGFFGARFRECAGRALLLTRQRFNQRLPLWMSRLQAKKLMNTVSRYSDFPVLLETWRTCLDDEFDLHALEEMLGELADGVIQWSFVATGTPSPFAANITFDQINRYMYADDSPEVGGPSALSDRLIADVVANEQLRPKISAATIARFEAKRQRRETDYVPESDADWAEWVKERVLIPLEEAPAERRSEAPGLLLITLEDRRWVTHQELYSVLIDRKLVDAGAFSGTAPAVADPRDAIQLASEVLSFYGPRTAEEIAELLPRVPVGLLDDEADWVTGTLTEDIDTTQYCNAENYEILLRFQRAALRPDVQARPITALPGWLASWQGFGEAATEDNLVDALLSLKGFATHLDVWLEDLLPARFEALPPAAVDEALRTAELQWWGTGREQITVGHPEDQQLLQAEEAPAPGDDMLTKGFSDPSARYDFSQLADAQDAPLDRFAEAFWAGVWQGQLSADTLTPLRQGLERGFALKAITATAGSMRRARRGAYGQPRSFAGYWQLTTQANARPEASEDPLTRLEEEKERARLLLDRYGFLCRELANREGGRLRWAVLFRALAMMELAGEIVSGYFFEGLSGPQFMTPGALQAFSREQPPGTFWLNACDPAAPTGLGLKAAELPQRRPQNYLSYLDDTLALVIENGGARLTFHLPPDHPRLVETLEPLSHLVRRQRRISVQTINDADARQSPYLVPIGTILKGVKDHKLITLESR